MSYLSEVWDIFVAILYVYVFSGVSLENLRENLEVLENLPLDFKDEIDRCVSSVKQIISKLLGSKVCPINLTQIKTIQPRELTANVFNLLSLSLNNLVHQELKDELVNLVVEKSELLVLSLRLLLVECNVQPNLVLIKEIIKANPPIKLDNGDTLHLESYLCSKLHEIDSDKKLEQISKLVLNYTGEGSDPSTVPTPWRAILKLSRFRSWITDQDSDGNQTLSLDEFAGAVSCQLLMKSDPLIATEKRILYNKLLENTDSSDEEKISTSLDAVISSHPNPEQTLPLLNQLRYGFFCNLSLCTIVDCKTLKDAYSNINTSIALCNFIHK